MDKREHIIGEIQRIATKLGTQSLTRKDFQRNSNISASTITWVFGSWNRAVEAAGLRPITSFVPVHKTLSDEELLVEVIRLTKELGKRPTDREMNAAGRFSPRPYIKRWGSFVKARETAYRKLGFPDLGESATAQHSTGTAPKPSLVPETIRPREPRQRKKAQFGEPIDFRGLRFAPINEQGVVYLFGMISRELGFLIESIRTEFPDCEGKRCVDKSENRWQQVLIEFEYGSRQFEQHGHSPDDCDLIVCWIHDWEESPVEVLELKSAIRYLS